jgi:MraZ protein
MFLGRQVYSLDSKSRLTIPAKYREFLSPTMVITRSPSEPYLLVLPLAEWTQLSQKVSSLSMMDPVSSLLKRVIFSSAEDLRADNQGRILISQPLRTYAQIETDVLIAGVNTYLELWNPVCWEERVTAAVDNGALNTQLSALGI